MGRPTKFTPETAKRIVDAIKLGTTYELAAAYGGVSYDSFHNWMKAGAAAKSGAYFQFFEQVKGAEGAAAVGWLAKIEKAASDGAWQAAAWKLERRYPKDYGQRITQRHSGDPDGAPIRTENAVHVFIPSNGREEPDDHDADPGSEPPAAD